MKLKTIKVQTDVATHIVKTSIANHQERYYNRNDNQWKNTIVYLAGMNNKKEVVKAVRVFANGGCPALPAIDEFELTEKFVELHQKGLIPGALILYNPDYNYGFRGASHDIYKSEILDNVPVIYLSIEKGKLNIEESIYLQYCPDTENTDYGDIHFIESKINKVITKIKKYSQKALFGEEI